MLAVAVALIALVASQTSMAFAQKRNAAGTASTPGDLKVVAPALERYRQGVLIGDLWARPGLSRRDRGVVTLAALIARNQTAEMPFYLDRALDDGVKPREISEIVAHLAFYCGWGIATAAVEMAKDVFPRRNITADQLPEVSPRRPTRPEMTTTG